MIIKTAVLVAVTIATMIVLVHGTQNLEKSIPCASCLFNSMGQTVSCVALAPQLLQNLTQILASGSTHFEVLVSEAIKNPNVKTCVCDMVRHGLPGNGPGNPCTKGPELICSKSDIMLAELGLKVLKMILRCPDVQRTVPDSHHK